MFFLKIADERFIIYCREEQSYNYCIKNNKKAKFYLCDDMAFYAKFDYLNSINYSNDEKFIKFKQYVDSYHKANNTNIANFLRNDLEKTV